MLITTDTSVKSIDKNREDITEEDTTDTDKYCQICLLEFNNQRHPINPDIDNHKCVNKCCSECVLKIYKRTNTFKCPFCREEYNEWINNYITELSITKKINKNNHYSVDMRNYNNVSTNNNIINNRNNTTSIRNNTMSIRNNTMHMNISMSIRTSNTIININSDNRIYISNYT
jgi:hypothetical protein